MPRGAQSAYRPAPPPSARPPVRRPPQGRVRRPQWGRRIRMALVTLLVLVIAGGIWVDVSLSRTDALPSDSKTTSRGTNWLIVGSDSRQQLTPEERKRYATGDETSQLTDTIMILHTGSGPTTLVSIPRDSLLNIPGHGVAKVNSAYARGGGPDGGGPELLVKSIENATGLHIDHYAEIGFLGVVKVVDAVGGVELDVPESIKDPKAALDIKAGRQTLDGPTALGYVRTRATASSDFGRVERQRALLSALLDKVTGPSTLLNPFRIVPLASQLSGAITVDNGDHVWDLARLAFAMRGLSDGISTTVPVADGAVHWDKTRAKALFAALANDEAPPKNALGP
ncbi:transcriptional attenuator, LytR family [Pseudonocardia thermophila]|uniref:Transcriptional attenuator, LytR family n=1 Tax=Pseudonocardia thermophila TaxID=1848 RepID=A0A1M6SIQ1_PSETH|nr:LCP family protein [Pseudonocardia thermophila]SHK44612.1 transcriptional attenuator, LytR family [Pseudonocardia thermophila]